MELVAPAQQCDNPFSKSRGWEAGTMRSMVGEPHHRPNNRRATRNEKRWMKKAGRKTPPTGHTNWRRNLAICLALAVATAAVYFPVASFRFLSYDDAGYVTGNERVIDGLSWQGVAWAFTTMTQANWHPLTWLSHMADCQCFGAYAGAHHLVNLAIHIVNSCLLYLALRRMTGAAWRSGMVAALFALHPLHVESVAWVAERKDVLSTMFGFAALWAYACYAQRPSPARYLAVLSLFAAGLMAKPMLVTLPLLMLLLDYWPLARWTNAVWPGRRLLLEKLPLFGLAAASCAITLIAQHAGGAVVSIQRVPIAARVGNAALAYVGYLAKTFAPVGLAPFYPHPLKLHMTASIVAALLLLGISIVFWRAGRRRPYLVVGWLWFLGALVPVIGLVQVGEQSMADRYTYLPLVGIFMLCVWWVADEASRWNVTARMVWVPAVGVLVACGVLTRFQVQHWADTETLFRYALTVTDDNHIAHNNVGIALFTRHDYDGAVRHYREALRIAPSYIEAHGNLGNVFMAQGKFDEAIAEYRIVARANPRDSLVHAQIGKALAIEGKLGEAEECFRETVRLLPSSAAARGDLAKILELEGKLEESIREYRLSLDMRRNQPEVLNNFAWLRATHPDARVRDGAEAVVWAELAVDKTPASAPTANALDTLAAAYAEAGRFDEAVSTARRAAAAAKATDPNLLAAIEERAELFATRRPYRDPALKGSAAQRP
jgi:protein O-mannosyl-transferase